MKKQYKTITPSDRLIIHGNPIKETNSDIVLENIKQTFDEIEKCKCLLEKEKLSYHLLKTIFSGKDIILINEKEEKLDVNEYKSTDCQDWWDLADTEKIVVDKI